MAIEMKLKMSDILQSQNIHLTAFILVQVFEIGQDKQSSQRNRSLTRSFSIIVHLVDLFPQILQSSPDCCWWLTWLLEYPDPLFFDEVATLPIAFQEACWKVSAVQRSIGVIDSVLVVDEEVYDFWAWVWALLLIIGTARLTSVNRLWV